MAEDNKKPKIDLRARLGKKTVAGGQVSIPPPMATGGAIPAPPFASKPPPPAEEKPKYREPQAIKIEMSEEVVQAQKKGKSKVIMVAAAMAVVGGMIGIALGGGMERSKSHGIALDGAKLMVEDIDKANVEIAKLSSILDEAKRSLSDGEFPTEATKKMADVNIPYDGTYLAGKGMGLMKPLINKMLVDFAGKSVQANEQKDLLMRMLTASESAYNAMTAQQKTPKMQWSVFVVNGANGPMAVMQPIPEPFLMSAAWPAEVEIPEGDKKTKLPLYKKDNPIGNPPMLIPVDPKSQSQVYPADQMLLSKLHSEIVALDEVLKGDKSDASNEKKGLVDLGTLLIDELKGIGH